MKIFNKTLLTASALALSITYSTAQADETTQDNDAHPVAVTQPADHTVVNKPVTVNTMVTADADVSDPKIVSDVNALLKNKDNLQGVNIDVESNDGVVSLSGKVKTDHQYETAVMLANSVAGVKDVNTDKFEVQDSKEPLSDVYTTAKVKGVLIKNKLVDLDKPGLWSLDVETKNHIVYLSGTVETEAQKQSAISAAQSVSGVVSVNTSGLKVEGKMMDDHNAVTPEKEIDHENSGDTEDSTNTY